ncbi:MAG: phosphoribosylformylglycinamidine synthase I [Deinococcus sp.]|nr:phosphoribosylformylglycinamidine synthase I [Deinococcus sp.]
MKPRALILHASGTNRDLEAAQAFQLSGADTEIVHVNQLRNKERRWPDYQILVIPGGFSYADALGAGRLLALDLKSYFADEVKAFVASGKPVIGICNGFQALVKAGILPGNVKATLTFNAQGRFECRWVTLRPGSKKCLWTKNLSEPIYCPVAHGEGNFQVADSSALDSLKQHDQIALTYAGKEYPDNPNGSVAGIAGICNIQGNVLGLMPHPEDHVFSYQHPRFSRGERGNLGLALFRSGVLHARELAR